MSSCYTSRQSDNRSPRILVPVGRAQSNECGHKVNTVIVRYRSRERFTFGCIRNQSQAIAKPLNCRARNKHTSLEGVFGSPSSFPRDRRQQA